MPQPSDGEEEEEEDLWTAQVVIFLRVTGVAIKVERSLKRALRVGGPMVVAHGDSIIDVSTEAAVLGVGRHMAVNFVVDTYPQVHIERPPFPPGINGIKDRYQEQAELVGVYLRHYCDGITRHSMSLEQVDWDEYFLDIELSIHGGGTEEEGEEVVLREADHLGRYIRAGLKGLGYWAVCGVGWTRGEAQENARQREEEGGRDEDEEEGRREKAARERGESAEDEKPCGGRKEAKEEEEERRQQQQQPNEGGMEVVGASGEGLHESSEGGTEGGGQDEKGGREEEEEEPIPAEEEEEERGEEVVMMSESSGGEEEQGDEEDGGHVCEKCRAWFETEEELNRHVEEARARDGKRKKRKRMGGAAETTVQKKGSPLSDHHHPHHQQQQRHLQHPPKPRARPLPPAVPAPRPAARLPHPGGGMRGQQQQVEQVQEEDSFTAVLDAMDDEEEIRDYLAGRGAPMILLPGWTLTPIDLTEESDPPSSDPQHSQPPPRPPPPPPSGDEGRSPPSPPQKQAKGRHHNRAEEVLQRGLHGGQGQTAVGGPSAGRGDNQRDEHGGAGDSHDTEAPLLILSNTSEDDWERTRLINPVRARGKQQKPPNRQGDK